jgi:phosphatidylinositol alpha-1,6-mannosyltransferase
VLFISKPVAPPFHDGTKCLVRDVARHLTQVSATLMSTSVLPELDWAERGRIELAPVYTTAGEFSPGLSQNLRAASWVLLHSRSDVWHFVFAPNPRTGRMARVLRALRRVPVLQTVASPPREFRHMRRLLFGDVVVAQSDWTRRCIERAYAEEDVPLAARPRLAVIPPPVEPSIGRSAEQIARARSALAIPDSAPLFVYPGDLEVSGGAAAVAALVPELTRHLPESIVVFAYRAKTPRAPEIARRFERELPPKHVRITGELPDVLSLIAGATAVLFPVDDLRGKVDLPIVLLESMALGVPVVALNRGPLAELEGAVLTGGTQPPELLEPALRLASDRNFRQEVVERQRRAVSDHYASARVARAYERLYLELLGDHFPA